MTVNTPGQISSLSQEERLDWFFTSNSWNCKYPNTLVKTMVTEMSDHWPCVIEVSTRIPRARIFRFENHWLANDSFIPVAVQGWSSTQVHQDPAKAITAKFKNLRRVLKPWSAGLPKLALAIDNIKLVLHFLEAIEGLRDLSLPEWNFRNLVTAKLIFLLKQQRTYWRQRGKIRWVREGDAGTRFFHAHATIRHRQNTISSLQDSNGSIQQTHEEKTALLWNSFKERLGISEISQMLFNLRDLLLHVDGLESLEAPFTKEEIDDIVAKLPNNKSDGFTNEFIKGCWPLLAEDFYWLCNAFNESNVCLRSTNSSHITLIPKKDGPQIVLDYRPISLLNTSLKLLTKLLANRLQGVIRGLIHKN